MDIQQVIIPLASFGAVAIASYTFLMLFDPYWRRVNTRVGELQSTNDPVEEAGHAELTSTRKSSRLIASLQQISSSSKERTEQLQKRLTKAGIYRVGAPSIYYVTRLLLIISLIATLLIVGLVGFLRMDLTLVIASAAAIVGAIAPSMWLDRVIHRRHLSLRKSLPDFLDLMTICLEAGLSLQETIKRVSYELRLVHPVLAGELTIVQSDIELGATVDQALKRFAIRTDYEGVRTLSTFIREAQRFGTNITEALRQHADMLRTQRELSAETNAQKAAVKIILPTLILIFPAIFIVAVGPAVCQIQEAFATK